MNVAESLDSLFFSSAGAPIASLSVSDTSSAIVTTNTLIFNSAVISFSPNVPADSGPGTFIVFDVPGEFNGQVLNLTDVVFVSIGNELLVVEVVPALSPLPMSPPTPNGQVENEESSVYDLF